ncbi:hypothetical protein K0U27_11300 [archaeon]|nr:hypothetical protein [archaeon]
MTTRYKILIVITITLSIQGGLFLGMTSCTSVSECQIFYDFYQYVGFSTVSQMCSIDEKENNLCNDKTFEIRANNDWYFLFFFVIVPTSAIITIWYRDRK